MRRRIDKTGPLSWLADRSQFEKCVARTPILARKQLRVANETISIGTWNVQAGHWKIRPAQLWSAKISIRHPGTWGVEIGEMNGREIIWSRKEQGPRQRSGFLSEQESGSSTSWVQASKCKDYSSKMQWKAGKHHRHTGRWANGWQHRRWNWNSLWLTGGHSGKYYKEWLKLLDDITEWGNADLTTLMKRARDRTGRIVRRAVDTNWHHANGAD